LRWQSAVPLADYQTSASLYPVEFQSGSGFSFETEILEQELPPVEFQSGSGFSFETEILEQELPTGTSDTGTGTGTGSYPTGVGRGTGSYPTGTGSGSYPTGVKKDANQQRVEDEKIGEPAFVLLRAAAPVIIKKDANQQRVEDEKIGEPAFVLLRAAAPVPFWNLPLAKDHIEFIYYITTIFSLIVIAFSKRCMNELKKTKGLIHG